jgi:hypothetical protein
VIDKILVMNDAGLSLYEWNPQGKEQDGLLLSGFVAALNAFAQHDRGEQIKKITLDPTTFIFSRARGLVFTILTRDPEFEKVITHIIEDLKERFVGTFGGTISDFRGSVAQFKPFDKTVNEILQSYGYFEYERLRNVFDSDASLRSILILDKKSGEPLYVKAKEYIDRKALSFQTSIVAKSAERLVSECFEEEVVDVNMVSEKMRSLLFRSTSNVHLVEEANLVSTQETSPVPTSEKKASKIVGSPNKLQTITSDPFMIFDHSGKIAYSSFKSRSGDLSPVVVNGVTAYESSKNVFQQVFKEPAWVSMLSSKDSTYTLFDVGGYIALVRIKREKEFGPSSVLMKVHQFQETFGQ